MPQVAIPIAASVAGSLASKAISGGGGGGDSGGGGGGGDSQVYRQKSADLYDSISLPSFDRAPYQRQNYVGDIEAETWAPWLAEFTDIDPDNAAAKAAQLEVLEQLKSLGTGGLSTGDRLAINGITQSQARSNQDALQQGINSLEARGLYGSGAERGLRGRANQIAADSGNQLFNQLFQQVLNRQMGATTAQGNLASTMVGQENNLASNRAQLANNFNQAIMGLRAKALSENASATNNTNQYNATNKQSVSNNNTGIANKELDRNNSLTQQEFANLLSKTQGQANAYNGVASGIDAGQAAAAMRDAGQTQAAINGAGLGLQALKAAGGVEGVTNGVSSLLSGLTSGGGANPEATSTSQAYDNGSGYGYFADGGLVSITKLKKQLEGC